MMTCIFLIMLMVEGYIVDIPNIAVIVLPMILNNGLNILNVLMC